MPHVCAQTEPLHFLHSLGLTTLGVHAECLRSDRALAFFGHSLGLTTLGVLAARLQTQNRDISRERTPCAQTEPLHFLDTVSVSPSSASVPHVCECFFSSAATSVALSHTGTASCSYSARNLLVSSCVSLAYANTLFCVQCMQEIVSRRIVRERHCPQHVALKVYGRLFPVRMIVL